jgi:3',5'-cyclic AMP phosphodiesterase CpdA
MIRHTLHTLHTLAASALMVGTIWAQAAATPPPLRADEEIHRPRPIPDRVVLTWTDDPATTQTVTWRTDQTVKKGVAQIMPAPEGALDADKPRSPLIRTIDATNQDLTTKLWPVRYHNATFRDLEPSTTYAYRVGRDSAWSEWFQFRTASKKAEPFTFLYFGDAQGGLRVLWPRVLRQAFLTAPDARFMAFGGDLVEDAQTDRHWGEFLHGGGWLFGTIPIIPAVGNHDYRGPTPDTHWRAQFTLPEHGPEGHEEYAFFNDYQGMRLISLNSMGSVGRQSKWLEGVLADNPNPWTVLMFHYPVFSREGIESSQAREWKQIIDKHGVDLVLNGHEHCYARTGLEGSAVYVKSVSGSKMYDIERKPWMVRAAWDTQLFQVIRIDGDRLSFEARTATGRLYDAFDLEQQPGKPNRLVEKLPAGTPERMKGSAPTGDGTQPKPRS